MRILVVDDDLDLMNGYADLLEQAGHTTVRCGSFPDARAAMKTNPFDVIVTDVRLGDRNGLGLLLDAAELRPDVQKVVMSGFDDPVLRRDAEELGAVFLLKPVAPEALFQAVRPRQPGRHSA
jgi:two-component system response regulator HydG